MLCEDHAKRDPETEHIGDLTTGRFVNCKRR